MTACTSLVRFPDLRSLALSRGAMAMLALAIGGSLAAAQSRPMVNRTVPANSPFRARLAAWQNEAPPMEAVPMETTPGEGVPMEQPPPARPPSSQSRLRPGTSAQKAMPPSHAVPEDYAAASLNEWIQSDGCATCGGHGCGACCGPMTCGVGGCGPRCCGPGGPLNCPSDPCLQCRPNLWWVRAELLLAWRSGRGYPPLVTTDPASEDSTTSGVLPDATVLYGGNVGDTTQIRAGMNLDFGTWLNDCQNVGIGGRYFFLGDDSGDFNRNSGQNAVLAVPFFSVDLGTNSSLLLAHPDIDGEVRSGSVGIRATSQVYGFDAYVRLLYCRTACGRVDFITGYHTSAINDDFILLMRTDGNQQNNNIHLFDEFNTENSFHGVILGILTEHQICCMTLKGKARVSLGNMHQNVDINGGTRVNGVLDQTEPGGLFTAASNIGSYSQDQFCAVTEAGLQLGYFINPHLQLTVGYNLMYWSSVVRPGDQIDTTVDDLNVPATSPTFQFNTSSFWVQSLNLGLNWEF